MEKKNISKQILQHKMFSPLRSFLTDSRSVGILLIVCTIISMVLANITATQDWYKQFWQTPIHLPFHFPEDYKTVVNDVLMTFFFFLVAIEIKRELLVGELSSLKKCLLPVMAALGGMLCPALLFWMFNNNTAFIDGWGIPMATDIAFSLGVLSLLGKKVPVQLKIFLAALAIIDDLGAIVTIAVFYTSSINFIYMMAAGAVALLIVAMNKMKINHVGAYLLPAVIMWYFLFNTGIHATISGVIVAFLMPLHKVESLEHTMKYPVDYLVLPLFALANTAILLPQDIGSALSTSLSYGVLVGLVVGKPLGIVLFSYIAVKAGMAFLPSHANWKQIAGIGMLGGIGFTMSIFTTGLAYSQDELQVISKVAVICGSLLSSVLGFLFLRRLDPDGTAKNLQPAANKQMAPSAVSFKPAMSNR